MDWKDAVIVLLIAPVFSSGYRYFIGESTDSKTTLLGEQLFSGIFGFARD